MDISHLIKPIRTLRSCIRQNEGGGGQCAIVSQEVVNLLQKYGADTVAGYFVTRDGEIVDDHWWIKLKDGHILDPTQDQFGDSGFGDVVIIPPKHPQQAHYFPFTNEDGIPYEVIDFSENLKDRIKKRKKAGLFSKLVDDYGGRPVGDANSQSSYDMPEYVTLGGQETVPDEEVEDEFKPEELEQKIRNLIDESTLNGGAGVLVYDPKIKRILVQKRKDNGEYDLFGGTLEEGETMEECARREAFEEGGLKFPKNSLKEIGTVSADDSGEYKDEPYTIFLYKGHVKVTKIQKKEVSGVKWIKPGEISNSNATSRLREALALIKKKRITEARQRGILYHFTEMHDAWSILSDGTINIGDTEGSMVGFGGGFAITHGRDGISLTRNPNLKKGPYEWGSVRIALDGNKLSNRYKIEPHLDSKHGITRQMNQAEELIRRDKIDIKGAILSIDFHYPAYMKSETDFDEWVSPPNDENREEYLKMAREAAAKFVNWVRQRGLPINVVKQFSGRRVKEVDHPEFMPGGNEEPRYDPNLYLGKYQQRDSSYNTGHPNP